MLAIKLRFLLTEIRYYVGEITKISYLLRFSVSTVLLGLLAQTALRLLFTARVIEFRVLYHNPIRWGISMIAALALHLYAISKMIFRSFHQNPETVAIVLQSWTWLFIDPITWYVKLRHFGFRYLGFRYLGSVLASSKIH